MPKTAKGYNYVVFMAHANLPGIQIPVFMEVCVFDTA